MSKPPDHTQWTVLWSLSQGAFHVEQLDQTKRNGVRTYLTERGADYILLEITDTRQEASEVINKLIQSKDANPQLRFVPYQTLWQKEQN